MKNMQYKQTNMQENECSETNLSLVQQIYYLIYVHYLNNCALYNLTSKWSQINAQ